MTHRDVWTPGRRAHSIAAGTLLLLVFAALAPDVTRAQIAQPTITGTPQVGATLQAAWDGEPETRPVWQWLRCETAVQSSCVVVGGVTGMSYAVTAADLGSRVRVRVRVRQDTSLSAPTAAVTAPSPEPGPEPGPEPAPEPAPELEPSPSPQPESTATPRIAAPAVPPAPAAFEVLDQQTISIPRMMSPAPIVRISGRLTRKGARITRLTVRAPRGARIALRCFGRGCPARRWAGTAALTRIARFQRVLRVGTKLVITVTKPRRIGKHTTIVIRRGAPPARRDRCLMPGSRSPVRCPAA